mmetsp:Transcript_2136/g.2205  ORF Transcript_2136/g.2205 Transcript_2136/m.2205 type:complete len:420 (+) Transcript_2136:1-1260(+)
MNSKDNHKQAFPQKNNVILTSEDTRISSGTNLCFSMDNFSISLCNALTKGFEYILIPFKYCLKFPLSQFERPYSFMMIINYFILITPLILLTVGLIQQSSLIFNESKFGFVYLTTFIILVLNYYFTFVLYDKYGIHKLQKPKNDHTVTSFIKYLFWYLFTEHKFGYVCLFWGFQLLPNVIMLNYLNDFSEDVNKEGEALANQRLLTGSASVIDNSTSSVNGDINNRGIAELAPAIVFFAELGIDCNIAFVLLHIIIYFSLFLVILCKINGSCLCLASLNWLCCCSCCYEDTMDITVTSSSVVKTEMKLAESKSESRSNQPEDVIEVGKEESNQYKIKRKSESSERNQRSVISLDVKDTKAIKKGITFQVSKSKGVSLYNSTEVSRVLPFVERFLEMFKFLKIFDYEKEMGDGEKILKDV